MTSPASKTSASKLQRAIGAGRLRTMQVAGKTRIADLYQSANAKIRVPKQHDDHLDAVLINTAGGLTGGDVLNWDMDAGPTTKTILSTQACERIYRAQSGTTRVATKINVEADAHFLWLPQETILFDGSSLTRALNATLADNARLTALEAIVLGREAMREELQNVSLIDNWRIAGNQGILHADAFRMHTAQIAKMANAAHLHGHRVFGTLIDLEPSRQVIDSHQKQIFTNHLNSKFEVYENLNLGVSSFAQKTIVRFTARTSYDLRLHLPDLLNEVVPGLNVPKVWRL
ncbi:MAG: urease accessory protein UreD [Pseudomonadota bacterium]